MRARIGRHLAWLGSDLTWTLEWHSLYRAHALSLDRYLHERIVFAGGCILYTTSNIIHKYNTNQHVAAALSLFASIALMFWYLLRILNRR